MAFAMPPPASPTGLGILCKEVQVQRAGALVNQVDEDRHQRRNHQHGRKHREAGDRVVGQRPDPRPNCVFRLQFLSSRALH